MMLSTAVGVPLRCSGRWWPVELLGSPAGVGSPVLLGQFRGGGGAVVRAMGLAGEPMGEHLGGDRFALSTFIAHVFAEASAMRVRIDRPLTWGELRHEASHAAPIASTAATPTLLMIGALAGWWPTTAALVLAIAITIGRLVALGWVVGRLSRRRVYLRPFVSGLLMGMACLAVAVLKWWLTH